MHQRISTFFHPECSCVSSLDQEPPVKVAQEDTSQGGVWLYWGLALIVHTKIFSYHLCKWSVHQASSPVWQGTHTLVDYSPCFRACTRSCWISLQNSGPGGTVCETDFISSNRVATFLAVGGIDRFSRANASFWFFFHWLGQDHHSWKFCQLLSLGALWSLGL